MSVNKNPRLKRAALLGTVIIGLLTAETAVNSAITHIRAWAFGPEIKLPPEFQACADRGLFYDQGKCVKESPVYVPPAVNDASRYIIDRTIFPSAEEVARCHNKGCTDEPELIIPGRSNNTTFGYENPNYATSTRQHIIAALDPAVVNRELAEPILKGYPTWIRHYNGRRPYYATPATPCHEPSPTVSPPQNDVCSDDLKPTEVPTPGSVGLVLLGLLSTVAARYSAKRSAYKQVMNYNAAHTAMNAKY